jgi:hypothetical protein
MTRRVIGSWDWGGAFHGQQGHFEYEETMKAAEAMSRQHIFSGSSFGGDGVVFGGRVNRENLLAVAGAFFHAA